MAPNTPHYVLTVQDSILHGRFMYSASTSQSTMIGFIHAFINGFGITNQHQDLLTFLRREMAMWLKWYKENPFFSRSVHPHVPDVLTAEGLRDIMAVGNMLELATVIDRRCYLASSLTQKELVEMGTARSMYRQILVLITRNFAIAVDGRQIHPALVFRRSLVEFGAALVVYRQEMDGKFSHSLACTPEKVKEKTISFFETHYPNLIPRLHQLIEARFEFLYWTGPRLSITPRTDQHRFFLRDHQNTHSMKLNKPLEDFIDAPLYPSPSNNLSARKGIDVKLKRSPKESCSSVDEQRLSVTSAIDEGIGGLQTENMTRHSTSKGTQIPFTSAQNTKRRSMSMDGVEGGLDLPEDGVNFNDNGVLNDDPINFGQSQGSHSMDKGSAPEPASSPLTNKSDGPEHHEEGVDAVDKSIDSPAKHLRKRPKTARDPVTGHFPIPPLSTKPVSPQKGGAKDKKPIVDASVHPARGVKRKGEPLAQAPVGSSKNPGEATTKKRKASKKVGESSTPPKKEVKPRKTRSSSKKK